MIIKVHKVLPIIAFIILSLLLCLPMSIPTHCSLARGFNPNYTFNIYTANILLSKNNWSLFIQPEIVSASVGKNILGTDFTRNGLMGRFTHSYLQYKNDDLFLFLGRSPLMWGQSKQYSIIQSGLTPTYDQFRFELKLGNLTGEILAGQLGSEMLDDHRITRLIGGHRLTGHFFNDKLQLQLGEQIIYTGENRNIELSYLNPAVPYVFAAYDGDDLNVNGFNNDNGMIFLNGRYELDGLLFDRLWRAVYFEFIIDDYQIHDNPVQNMLGWKMGFEGQSEFYKYQVNWETEYTQIDSWTYIHHGQSTNWQNRGHSIGCPYGPDLRSFFIHGNTWLKNESLKLEVEYT